MKPEAAAPAVIHERQTWLSASITAATAWGGDPADIAATVVTYRSAHKYTGTQRPLFGRFGVPARDAIGATFSRLLQPRSMRRDTKNYQVIRHCRLMPLGRRRAVADCARKRPRLQVARSAGGNKADPRDPGNPDRNGLPVATNAIRLIRTSASRVGHTRNRTDQSRYALLLPTARRLTQACKLGGSGATVLWDSVTLRDQASFSGKSGLYTGSPSPPRSFQLATRWKLARELEDFTGTGSGLMTCCHALDELPPCARREGQARAAR